MRLPEAKIKEAIAHPERLVRQEALRYFAGCHSRDAWVPGTPTQLATPPTKPGSRLLAA